MFSLPPNHHSLHPPQSKTTASTPAHASPLSVGNEHHVCIYRSICRHTVVVLIRCNPLLLCLPCACLSLHDMRDPSVFRTDVISRCPQSLVTSFMMASWQRMQIVKRASSSRRRPRCGAKGAVPLGTAEGPRGAVLLKIRTHTRHSQRISGVALLSTTNTPPVFPFFYDTAKDTGSKPIKDEEGVIHS